MRRILLFALLIGVLAACGDANDESDDLRGQPFEVVEPTMVVVVEGCETRDLENWYETATTNTQLFLDEAFGYATTPREAMPGYIDRLTSLSDSVLQTAVPECANDTHALLLDIMSRSLASFNGFYAEEIDQATLLVQVEEQRTRFNDEARPLIDNLANTLNERFQQGQ